MSSVILSEAKDLQQTKERRSEGLRRWTPRGPFHHWHRRCPRARRIRRPRQSRRRLL